MLKQWMMAGALFIAAAAPAQAAVVVTGAGPRVGFSIDPSQVILGGHVVLGEVAPNITFDPSLELGFGDNLTTIALNFDLHHHFTLQDSDWRPYVGAGIGITFVEVDAPGRDNSTTDVGGALILGAGTPTRSGNRFFSELKLGLGDIAALKLVVGWNFKM